MTGVSSVASGLDSDEDVDIYYGDWTSYRTRRQGRAFSPEEALYISNALVRKSSM